MTYSQDLRVRVMAEVKKGEDNHADIADRFQIHQSTLDKWWARLRTTGSCAALPHVSGPERTLAPCETLIRSEIKKQPDASLAELRERVATQQGIVASASMLCRELKILGLRRKKSRSRIASGRRPA